MVEALHEGAKRDASLESGELVAEAEVRSEREGEVAVRVAAEVELFRLFEDGLVKDVGAGAKPEAADVHDERIVATEFDAWRAARRAPWRP